MPIRLLSKSEVDKAKSLDRKNLIDEGVKLAKRVDSLRETAAQEDSSLQKFRNESVSRIYTEIREVTVELDSLRADVSVLKKEKTDIERLLGEDWNEVGKAQPELLKLKKTLQEDVSRIKSFERVISTSKELVTKELREAEHERLQSDELLRKAYEDSKEAKSKKERADSLLLEVRQEKIKSEKELDDRIANINYREKKNHDRDRELAERESELSSGWTILNDRRAMFERTLKRAGIKP